MNINEVKHLSKRIKVKDLHLHHYSWKWDNKQEILKLLNEYAEQNKIKDVQEYGGFYSYKLLKNRITIIGYYGYGVDKTSRKFRKEKSESVARTIWKKSSFYKDLNNEQRSKYKKMITDLANEKPDPFELPRKLSKKERIRFIVDYYEEDMTNIGEFIKQMEL